MGMSLPDFVDRVQRQRQRTMSGRSSVSTNTTVDSYSHSKSANNIPIDVLINHWCQATGRTMLLAVPCLLEHTVSSIFNNP